MVLRVWKVCEQKSREIYFSLIFCLTRDKVNYKIIEIKPLKKSREATKEDTVKMAVAANFRVTLPRARFFYSS